MWGRNHRARIWFVRGNGDGLGEREENAECERDAGDKVEKKMNKVFSAVAAFAAVMLVSVSAFAQTGAAAYGSNVGFMALAVAFGIGAAALGGALGQGRASSAALEGISRNPNASDKVFVPMILGLAFIESLVLFTWVLMLLLLQKF